MGATQVEKNEDVEAQRTKILHLFHVREGTILLKTRKVFFNSLIKSLPSL